MLLKLVIGKRLAFLRGFLVEMRIRVTELAIRAIKDARVAKFERSW